MCQGAKTRRRAQKSAAAATLLGAPSHHAAQPHPRPPGSAARTRVAAVQRHLWRARSGLPAPIGTAEPDATLLREQLALHDLIAQQMKAQEKRIAAEFKTEAMHQHLLSVPGIGPTLAAVIGCEIDQIARFNSRKNCAPMRALFQPLMPVEAKPVMAGFCPSATNGYAGR